MIYCGVTQGQASPYLLYNFSNTVKLIAVNSRIVDDLKITGIEEMISFLISHIQSYKFRKVVPEPGNLRFLE